MNINFFNKLKGVAVLVFFLKFGFIEFYKGGIIMEEFQGKLSHSPSIVYNLI